MWWDVTDIREISFEAKSRKQSGQCVLNGRQRKSKHGGRRKSQKGTVSVNVKISQKPPTKPNTGALRRRAR